MAKKKQAVRMQPKKVKTKNLFKTERGKWCLDVTIKGKRVIRVIGTDKKEAEDALAVIRTDLLRGKLQIGPKKTATLFKVFAQRYLETHASKKRSYNRDLGAYNLHLKKYFGELPLSEIKLEAVERY